MFHPSALSRPLRAGAIVVAAIVGALVLASCSSSEPEGSSLSVTVVGEGVRDEGLTARLAAELSAATLIERDSAGQLVGGLASSWRFVDEGRVLILRLRPVKWSDDEPLVADEVVASFRRAARSPSPEPGFRLAGIKAASDVARGQSAARLGVLAPTSRVVEMRLDAPAPQLLDWLAEPGLSVRRRDQPTLSRYVQAPATAQKASKVTPPAPLVLTRRDETASVDARPSSVTLRATRDAASAIADFRRGAADIVVGEGLTGLLEARVQGRRDELRLDRLHGVYGWRINAKKGALADPAIRRLLAESIDRAAIARSFGLAAIQPEAGLLPVSLRTASGPADLSPLANAAEPPPTTTLGDSAVEVSSAPVGSPLGSLAETLPEVGRAMVAEAVAAASNDALPDSNMGEAGDATGKPLLILQLLVPPGREHAQVAQRVAANWRALGIQIVLVEADAATRARLVASGDFDLAVDETSLPVPDAAALLDRFRCGQGPHCNDAADALLAAARMAPADQRPGQLAVVEAILREGPPFIGLFGAVRWALVSPSLDGWTSNSSGVHSLARIGRGSR
jgi:ABC-type transport system substrate-binding protein